MDFLKKYGLLIVGVVVVGGIIYLVVKSKSSSSSSNLFSTAGQTATNTQTQYLIPYYGPAGNPDNQSGGNNNQGSGGSNNNPPGQTSQTGLPYIQPISNFSAIPGLSSSVGQGQVNPNTNPGYDTFHIGSTNLTVEQLAQDIYPEVSPDVAITELEAYNPGLGNSPQSANNVLSNNFITIPTQPNEGVVASQQVPNAA